MKFLVKKNFRFVYLIIFLSLVFSGNIIWFKKYSLFGTLNQKFKETSQVLAQEFAPYFFPHFPQRLIYLVSEINLQVEELVKLSEALNDQLKESDCKFTLSQCLPKITVVKCESGAALGSPYKDITEVKEKEIEIADRFDNLSFLKELLEKEMEDVPQKELITLRPEVAEELKGSLNNILEKSKEIIKIAEENKSLYSQDPNKNCIASCQPGPSCEIEGCLTLGSGPQRNINITAKAGVRLDDLDLGEASIDKINLFLPDKINFPSLGDIIINIPPQTASVCFPFGSVNISVKTPSFSHLPSLSFTCPRLPFNLESPKIPVFKLPGRIEFSAPESRKMEWCKVPEVSGGGEVEITQGEINKKIQEIIDKINEEISKTSDKLHKKELEKVKEGIEKEYEKIKGKLASEDETPPIDFSTPGDSFSYQYQSPTSQGPELRDISLSYQCPQTGDGDKKVKPGAESNWYLETLSWLMEQCANLPSMFDSKTKIPAKELANCYEPNLVVKTIVEECDKYWKKYCSLFHYKSYYGSFYEIDPSMIPGICQKINAGCFKGGVLDGEIASAIQCQDLFKKEGLTTIPQECSYQRAARKFAGYYFSDYDYYCPNPKYPILRKDLCFPKNFKPVSILENKCRELKGKYPEKPPEPCKILPLFTGKIESVGSAKYFGPGTSCPSQKILNLPLGFGGSLGFNCPIGLPPSLPKIVLPDIIIPDIILPEFSIPPFLRIKLPKIIFEDLLLPDIELCDLNDCSNIFPVLNFRLPSLNLSSFDISSTPIPQSPNLELRSRVDFPSINFSLPQLELFNLLLPELKLPAISLPSPKINFAITGIDLNAIFNYIFTFFLNALGKPERLACISTKLETGTLSIVFPDYYFSFEKFPEVPKINFCKDINRFCKNVKNSLGENGWLKEAKKIESELNKNIENIQKELDKVSRLINEELQKQISLVFKNYGETISEAIKKQLEKKGLPSLEDYNYDLSKIPFPGVFPVKRKEGECLPVPLPGTKIILKIVREGNLSEPKVEKKDGQITILIPLDLPTKIPISWPEELKKIKLTNPLTYELPKIPLNHLSFEREFSIKGPGFQPITFSFNFGQDKGGDCEAKPPTSGNPFPINEITNKINEMRNIKMEIDDASQKVIRILQ